MLLADPRRPQILVLAALLCYGVFFKSFVVSIYAIPAAIGTALLLEHLLARHRGRPKPPYESALISALSTLLLFRSEQVWAYAAVVAFAITSKLIRLRGRHFLNPTNAGVLFGMWLLPGWITSGQWGHDVIFAFALCGGAALILVRAGTLDSAVAFIGGTLIWQIVIRWIVYGYPWASILHHFENGALWLFGLYMITDPRTTPKRRRWRVVHGLFVSLVAVLLLQLWWIRDSFLWALLIAAPFVVLFDLFEEKSCSIESAFSPPSPSPS